MKIKNKTPDKLKETKTKKAFNKKNENELTQKSYFRLLKDLEKDNAENKLNEELKPIENSNKKQIKSINEVIYNKNIKKLGKYYNKNKGDLVLYGSSKYDRLPVNTLVKQMTTYKERVVDNLLKDENNENEKEKEKSKIVDVVTNYVNCRDKLILTPLAENEKERNEMEKIEKKNFDEAERTGVVLRRIEYSTVIHKRADFEKNEKNKDFINKLTNSVNLIAKTWLKYKRRKMQRLKELKERQSFGNFNFQYIAEINYEKKIKQLSNKYDELYKIYEELLKEKNMKEKEFILKNSEINENLDKLNRKYGKSMEDFKKLKKKYENIINEKKEKEEKIVNLEKNNVLLKDKISNMDKEFKIIKNNKTLLEDWKM